MATKTYVDRMLVHWGEDLLWEDNHRVQKKPPVQITLKSPRSTGGSGSKADHVRQHVAAMTRKAPQVMVKITGGGADMRKISAHIDYIARAGKYKQKNEPELEIETDDGQVIQGKEARQHIKDMFEHSGAPIPKEVQELDSDTTLTKRKRREALNVILSMPHGINRDAVKAAASATANKLFAGNYLFAMVHHEDTDHQHTHIVVKMVGHDGKRLNPRKADLENWRITFAKELNARGIDAVATRRRVRLQRQKGESQSVRQIKDRGGKPKRESTSITQEIAKKRGQANDRLATKAYSEIAKTLSTSDSSQDRQLAKDLKSYLMQHGIAPSKSIRPTLR
jgi:hypothetical protein